VSHEPPKGILDMTYHGFSAGSAYLRELVEHAEHKPRLWLCGHIHESRGVISKHFHPERGHIDDIDASTMVINASNANSGKANRLVSGAVLVEIERRPSDTWGEESAESTLRSRRIDHDDLFLDSADRSDGLARLGDELELYTTRPGVRRRIIHYTNANCVRIFAQSPNQRNLMPLLNCDYASIHRLSTHMQIVPTRSLSLDLHNEQTRMD
jgi:hypothetical protein